MTPTEADVGDVDPATNDGEAGVDGTISTLRPLPPAEVCDLDERRRQHR